MKKSYVIIVGASELVMPAYKIAKYDLNLGTIALDYDANAPGILFADEALIVSTKDIDQAVDASRKISKKYKIVGVFTEGADTEVTVAAISRELSLPGISVEVAERCNNKQLMHAFLDKKGFKDKANYKIVSSLDEAYNGAKYMKFSLMIKPINNCASRGVQRIDSISELALAYKYSTSYNLSGAKPGYAILEEYLEGTKHTVEMMCYEGKWYLLSIIDTHYISPKWPCETGLNTTTLDKKLQRRLFYFSKNAANLIGINFNAHKVDVNLSKNGEIKLIELTARLSGGFHCQYVSPLAYGSNDIRAALKLAIGETLDLEDIRHKYEKGAAVRAIFPKPGVVKSIKGVKESKLLPGVEKVFILKKIGDRVGHYRNSADRVGFVIARGETTKEAIENAERGVEKINIITDDISH